MAVARLAARMDLVADVEPWDKAAAAGTVQAIASQKKGEGRSLCRGEVVVPSPQRVG